MNKTRIGIIGTGVGIRTLVPGFRRVDLAEIYAITGSSPERSTEFAKQQNIPHAPRTFRDLVDMPEIEIVCVCSPNAYHYEQAMYTIKKGKHLLCEKPLALTVEQAEGLVKAASQSSHINVVDHQLRFNPYVLKTKELIESNSIGRPYFARIHQQSTGFANRDLQWNWSFDEDLGGGVRMAMASHLIDLTNFWFKRRCLKVVGTMDLVIPERKTSGGERRKVTTCSFFSSSLIMENSLTVQLSATAASCGIPRFDYSIYGTGGEIHFDLGNKLSGAFLGNRGKVESITVEDVTPEERQNKVSIFSGSFVYFAPVIVEAARNSDFTRLGLAASFEDALRTQLLLEAIRSSAVKGSCVTISKGYVPGSLY